MPINTEKAMAPHSSTLAWKIPWMEEPVRLQSMGLRRAGHNWATSLSLFTFMHWRRKWQPTPVFLPGESQGWGSLVGYCLWGHTELAMIEVMQQQQPVNNPILGYQISTLFWSTVKTENKSIQSSLIAISVPLCGPFVSHQTQPCVLP